MFSKNITVITDGNMFQMNENNSELNLLNIHSSPVTPSLLEMQ